MTILYGVIGGLLVVSWVLSMALVYFVGRVHAAAAAAKARADMLQMFKGAWEKWRNTRITEGEKPDEQGKDGNSAGGNPAGAAGGVDDSQENAA